MAPLFLYNMDILYLCFKNIQSEVLCFRFFLYFCKNIQLILQIKY